VDALYLPVILTQRAVLHVEYFRQLSHSMAEYEANYNEVKAAEQICTCEDCIEARARKQISPCEQNKIMNDIYEAVYENRNRIYTVSLPNSQ
jgi:hypothetical protein